ncbi:hypothetical protein P3X46_020024 [Hevea brasiliensis]|uniref:RNase H type-1 domain-containing protein n=1 Tax=Hevea brasiliensis TaxID=3981 RepID=A0ABQ9LKL3_HEVBR|nr:hypothetical protein P3X46_020024 [Hevea brasiliensis]
MLKKRPSPILFLIALSLGTYGVGFLNGGILAFAFLIEYLIYLVQWKSLINGAFQSTFWDNLLYAIIWTIWLSTTALFSLVLHRLATWMKALNPAFPYNGSDSILSPAAIKAWTNPIKTCLPIPWSAPTFGSLKWNVDGSSLGKPGKCAIGGVLRDSSGIFLYIFSCPAGEEDSNAVELMVIKKVLELSCTHRSLFNSVLSILVDSDLQNAISWVKNPDSAPWSLSSIVNAIVGYIDTLPRNVFSHSSRESNFVADTLAKQGLKYSSYFVALL